MSAAEEFAALARDTSLSPDDFEVATRALWDRCPEEEKYAVLWAISHDVDRLLRP